MRWALLTLLVCASARGAIVHVAKSGNDANRGTSDKPFLTITRAVRDLKAGDGVLVHAGTYAETVTIWRKKGTQKAPIDIHRFANDAVIIDGGLTLNEVEWMSLSGFEVRNSRSRGIMLWHARHTSIRWMNVHDTFLGGILASDSSDIRIEGNTIRNTALQNRARTATQDWPQALAAGGCERVIIRDNHVFENYGEGIDAVRSNHVTIAGNTVHANYSVNIYLDNARDVVVDGNFVFSTHDTRFHRDDRPAHGIVAANERYTQPNPLRFLTITNNVVLWCRSGFAYGNYQAGGGLHATTIANNTFYASTEALMQIEDGAHDTTKIVNNLFYASGGRAYTKGIPRGIAFRANAWFGGDAKTIASGAGDVRADPRLVNAGGGRAADYDPRPDSPLVAPKIGARSAVRSASARTASTASPRRAGARLRRA
ncbi:MAG TPA: right-handed parallel beta-helix repeat-containing protein [Thermoanaerobaculia bacterium]|nr:right-handed parallel beta-helix repeat-containing protein [Thermoanaerobaculia bacterium]